MSQVLLKLTPVQLSDLTVLAHKDSRTVPQFIRAELTKLGHMKVTPMATQQSSQLASTPNPAELNAELELLDFES